MLNEWKKYGSTLFYEGIQKLYSYLLAIKGEKTQCQY